MIHLQGFHAGFIQAFSLYATLQVQGQDVSSNECGSCSPSSKPDFKAATVSAGAPQAGNAVAALPSRGCRQHETSDSAESADQHQTELPALKVSPEVSPGCHHSNQSQRQVYHWLSMAYLHCTDINTVSAVLFISSGPPTSLFEALGDLVPSFLPALQNSMNLILSSIF